MTANEIIKELQKITSLVTSGDIRVIRNGVDLSLSFELKDGKDGPYIEMIDKQLVKPTIELIQRSWYMEGYHDSKFGMEPMWTVKAQKGGPVFERNPRYGEKLEEEPSEDLEKGMQREFWEADIPDYYPVAWEDGFRRGAKWQKKQIAKECNDK